MAQDSTQVAPGVHRIRLGYSNAYVLADGGSFTLIDAGTPWDTRRLSPALAPFGGVARCKALLLTHAHPDHAGSAAFVAQHSAASVAAHEEERPFLESGRLYGSRAVQSVVFKLGSFIWPVRQCRLSRALVDGEEVQTEAGAWRVVHTPGHTRGHVSFFREADGVLISGDAVLSILPWTRRRGLTLPLRLFGEDEEAAMESARRLARLGPSVLLAGHGETLRDAGEPLRRWALR